MRWNRGFGIALAMAGVVACTGQPLVSDGVFLNHEFEHTTPEGYPLAWYVEGDPATAFVAVDDSRPHRGERGLHVKTSDDVPVPLYRPLFIGRQCVTEISTTAAVHTGEGDIEVALFFMEPGSPPQMGESIGDTGDAWREAAASISTSEGCLPGELLIGILVTGEGEAWVDDLEVSTDALEYEISSSRPAGPESRDVSAIEKHAIEVRSLDPAAEHRDLDRAADLFRHALVVGLGENSHGARGLFRLKHRLVRYLVLEMGFTAFALEMPAVQAGTVGDYVLGRSDDHRAALLALSYPAWQSEEMWALVEWLREHNASATTPVTFHGLDTERSDDRGDDARMADEVFSLLDDAPAEIRVILWADNTHVTKDGDAMGARLSERFGDSYVAVGFTYDAGHYSAYGPAIRYRVHPGYVGTHEHVLAKVAMDAFLLDLDRIPDGNVLHRTLGFRYIGSRPQEMTQFFPHRLRDHFDVIGFVERTDNTRYLLEHEF